MLALSACDRTDSQKFDAVYRSGKAIESAVSSGTNIIKYRELLQAMDAEISILKDRAKGPKELKLLELYESAARSYTDALVLWQLKIEGGSDFLYLGPTLEKMLKPYDIRYEGDSDLRHGSSSAAIKIIWEEASKRLNAANALLHGA